MNSRSGLTDRNRIRVDALLPFGLNRRPCALGRANDRCCRPCSIRHPKLRLFWVANSSLGSGITVSLASKDLSEVGLFFQRPALVRVRPISFAIAARVKPNWAAVARSGWSQSPATSSGRAARIPDTVTCVEACRWAEVQVSWNGGKLGKWADVVSQACASPSPSARRCLKARRVAKRRRVQWFG
jgi:hypothetical protein